MFLSRVAAALRSSAVHTEKRSDCLARRGRRRDDQEEAENHRPVKASMTNCWFGGKEGETHGKADKWLHCGLLVTSDIRSARSVNTEASALLNIYVQ